MTASVLSGTTLAVLLVVLLGLFIFIATRHWGVNWYTWLLGMPGSMKKGFLVIIALFALFLLIGYALGIIFKS